MADNLEKIESIINNLKDKFMPDKNLMDAIAEEMYASVMNLFQTQGAAVGGWQPLKSTTIKQKRRKGLIESILQARGDLLHSIQSSSTNNEAIVSTNKIYAAIHHYGGVINIAARTRTLFHRTNAKGNLLKQKDYPNLIVFAGKNHKNKVPYTFGQKSYSITIPARPFMVLTDYYKNRIIDIINDHINQ